jgi:hypothetical protein
LTLADFGPSMREMVQKLGQSIGRRQTIVLLVAAGAAAGCTLSPADRSGADADSFMRAYTEAWNRHDAALIARDFYRLGRTIEEQTAALESQFVALRAQGYVRSDIHQILTCRTGPDTAWAGMTFTRLKADGEALPPQDRASQYDLKRDPAEGWKITRLRSLEAGAPLACPAS